MHSKSHVATFTALAAVAALTLAGCSSTGSDTPSSQAGSCKQVTMTGLSWAYAILNPAVEEYNKTADVKVELKQGPDNRADYTQQLTTAKLSGNTPDIFQNQDVIADQLWNAGFSEDLTNWFGKGENGLTRDSFAAPFLASYIPQDDQKVVTGLPVGADATVVYYNKKIFEEAGVPLPSDDWTYDEFNATATKISDAGQGKYFGLEPAPTGSTPVSIWTAQYEPAIDAYGGFKYDPEKNVVGIGEPEAIKAWTQILTPWQDGGAPAYQDMGGTAPDFKGGEYAMVVGVRANLPSFADAIGDDLDVAQMPVMNGKRPVGGGSYGLGISAASNCKADAWNFINWFFTSGETLLEQTGSVVPPTIDGIASGAWRDVAGPPANKEAFASAITDATIFQPLPGGAQATLDKAVLTAIQQVLLNGDSVESAFQAAQETVNAELKRQG